MSNLSPSSLPDAVPEGTSLHGDPVTAYALSVASGEAPAGPIVRDACKRHLLDLERGHERGLAWDLKAALRVIDFFRVVLRFPDGEKSGEPFVLEPWQCFVVGSLFGWKRAATGLRRFKTAYVETGKGSGKSPLGAGTGLYMMVADGQDSPECYVAAVTRDQAKIAFRDAVRMVDRSRPLTKHILQSGKREVYNLAHGRSGGFFRPISSEGKGLDGKRVHFALLDEVHEHPSAVVVNKMTAGIKGLPQPIIFEITNSGYDRNSICYQHHLYSQQVCAGLIEDDEWFAYVCALDEGDDPFESEDCWAKVNPSLGVTIRPDYLRKQVREARNMPSNASIVRRLNFCEWTDAANPWISGELWRACEFDLELSDYEGQPCWGSLDLSGTSDLTALGLVFPRPDGGRDAFVRFWTPLDTLVDRARRDKVPYDAWQRQGFLDAPPGNLVRLDFVADTLAELAVRFDLKGVAYDPYRIKYLQVELDRIGVSIPLIAHPQGYYRPQKDGLWFPRSVDVLEKAVLDQSLRVQRNPVLTWNSASAVLVPDPKNNRIFDKRKSTGRIDGIVALAMAMGAASDAPEDDNLDDWLNNAAWV